LLEESSQSEDLENVSKAGKKIPNDGHYGSFQDFDSLLDKSNRIILSILGRDPTLSQVEIAKQLGLSQSSVALRLQKLINSGILVAKAGIDFQRLGVSATVARVLTSETDLVVNWAKSCPLFILGSVGIGADQLSLMFVTEDYDMMNAVINLHLRKLAGVKNVEASPIVSWIGEDRVALPLDLAISKSDSPPCAMMPYCPNCPANPGYKGRIWKEV
jgi:DNA-binding Lrp family transcriptional regulator